MGDDWDLHAVIRSSAAAGTKFVSSTVAATTDDHHSKPFPILPENHFPALIDNGIPVVYEDCGAAAQAFHPFPEFLQMQPPVQMKISRSEILQYRNPSVGISSPNFTAANNSDRPIRPRKRKISKIVCKMTAEELTADSWAWRKYGQKPIKGSPYPRNYYRCSSSKGCAARRQVERSPDDPGVLIVSYTGEHTHARSSNLSSLAGSSCGKLTAAAAGKAGNGNNNAASSSSFGSGSSASLTTAGVAVMQKEYVYMAVAEAGASREDNTIPIPYNDVDDDEI